MTFLVKSTLRKWGGLTLVLIGIGGLFLVNSVLIYQKLSLIDDEFLQRQRQDGWPGQSSSRKRHLAKGSIYWESHWHDGATSEKIPAWNHERGTKSNRGFRDTVQKAPTFRQGFAKTIPSAETERVQRSDLPYDIYDCPLKPPRGYPKAWKVLDVLRHWNVDTTDLPKTPIYQGLCVFDWHDKKQREMAFTYREAELPFIVRNHPGVMQTAKRFSSPGYLNALLGNKPQRNEHGKTNHLMFWRTLSPVQQKEFKDAPTIPPGWKPPTDTEDLTFAQWYQKARALENPDLDQTQQEHWYFRINAFDRVNRFLYNEMPYFDPDKHAAFMAQNHSNAFLMVDPEQHRGVNCRFGMRGLIAELHYDSTNNFVVLLGGLRRYILGELIKWSMILATLHIHLLLKLNSFLLLHLQI